MLLIAQPKSASTSLVSTIGKLSKRSWHQLEFAKNNVGRPASLGPSSVKRTRIFEILPHSDMVEYTKKELIEMSNHRDFFKQHVPPTKNNLEIILSEKVKCVVLLRKPKSSVEAYKNISKKRRLIKDKNDFDNKLKFMKEFHNGYAKIKKCSHIKIVYFEDLVINQEKVLKDIMRFYGIKIGNARFELDKKRYTGIGIKNLNEEIKKKEEAKKKKIERAKQATLHKIEINKEKERETEERMQAAIEACKADEPVVKISWWKRLLLWFSSGK